MCHSYFLKISPKGDDKLTELKHWCKHTLYRVIIVLTKDVGIILIAVLFSNTGKGYQTFESCSHPVNNRKTLLICFLWLLQSSSPDGLVSILKRRRASLDGLPPPSDVATKQNSKRKVRFSEPEDGIEQGTSLIYLF